MEEPFKMDTLAFVMTVMYLDKWTISITLKDSLFPHSCLLEFKKILANPIALEGVSGVRYKATPATVLGFEIEL